MTTEPRQGRVEWVEIRSGALGKSSRPTLPDGIYRKAVEVDPWDRIECRRAAFFRWTFISAVMAIMLLLVFVVLAAITGQLT